MDSINLSNTEALFSKWGKIALDFGIKVLLAIVIFIVVGVIAWLGFRQTKTLEEL